MAKYTFYFLTFILCASCSLNDNSNNTSNANVDFTAVNDTEIQAYIEANNLTAEKTDTGLYVVIDNPGTGKQPTITNNVTVAYRGYFTDNRTFDESPEAGVSFNMNRVILGWQEGIAKFKEGGSGMLLIPSHLAYGNQGTRGIPGGAVILFDINLIAVN